MKKFALLFSSVAVASSAFAVVPEVNAQQSETRFGISVPAREVTGSKTAVKGLSRVGVSLKKSDAVAGKVMNKAPKAMTVGYEEPDGLFALGLNDEGRGFFNGLSLRFGPAFKPLKWTNTSVGATEYEWEYSVGLDSEGNDVFEYSSDFDLVKPEDYSLTIAPTLYAVDAESNSASYQKGATVLDGKPSFNTMYRFGGNTVFESMDLGMSTYMYGDDEGGVGNIPDMAYNTTDKDFNSATHLDKIFTNPNPDGFGFADPKFVGYANFFKAPAAPYFMTKMWCSFIIKAKKATVAEMTLYKVDEEGYVTDEVIAKGSASIKATPKEGSQMLNFDLYALDEDGLEIDEVLVIDCPFMAMVEFNAADLDMVAPVAGLGTWPASDLENENLPVNGFILLDVEDELRFVHTPFYFVVDEARTKVGVVTDWMWMTNAIFPWLYEVDGETTKQAPNEGGEVVFDLSSYIDLIYAAFILPDDCDWIDLDTAVLSDGNASQILTLPVAALPEGVEGRSAKLTIEYPASSIELTINQGEGNAVNVVVADKNTQYFDLQGRRVANPDKGIYIKKAGNKTEKVIL